MKLIDVIIGFFEKRKAERIEKREKLLSELKIRVINDLIHRQSLIDNGANPKAIVEMHKEYDRKLGRIIGNLLVDMYGNDDGLVNSMAQNLAFECIKTAEIKINKPLHQELKMFG